MTEGIIPGSESVSAADESIVVPCPICGDNVSSELFVSEDLLTRSGVFTVARCRSCTTLYTRKRPSEEHLWDFYPRTFYESAVGPPSALPKELPLTTRIVLQAVYGYPLSLRIGRGTSGVVCRVARYLGRDSSWVPYVPDGRLLDIGAGRGAVLKTYAALGWSVAGVEPDQWAAEQARATGLEVMTGFLTEGQYESASFDAVILNHALEHTPNPVSLLAEAARILRARGWLLIRVPNAASLEAQAYGRYWRPWEVPRHLVHFGPKTLTALLDRTGYDVVRLRTEWRPRNSMSNASWMQSKRRGKEPRVDGLKWIAAAASAPVATLGYAPDIAVLARPRSRT